MILGYLNPKPLKREVHVVRAERRGNHYFVG